MDFGKLIKDSRIQVAATLFVIWILAVVWHFRTLNSFLYPLISIGVVTVSDVAITWIRYKKKYFPASSFVTGLLIGLILSPTEPFWVIIVAALIASISKQFIALGPRRHIFNPAAFGIVVTSLIFRAPVAWWAVSWSRIPIIILVGAMAYILWKVKRFYLPIAFLAVYFVVLVYQSGLNEALAILLDGTVALFALVMLPEPITSPVVGEFKILFGVIVAVLSIIFSQSLLNRLVNDAFLPALLVGDLIAFLSIKYKDKLLAWENQIFNKSGLKAAGDSPNSKKDKGASTG